MSKKYATEIEANIERAEESLNAAKELLHKHYNGKIGALLLPFSDYSPPQTPESPGRRSSR